MCCVYAMQQDFAKEHEELAKDVYKRQLSSSLIPSLTRAVANRNRKEKLERIRCV